MKAGRSSSSNRNAKISLALSCSFLCAQFAMANPEVQPNEKAQAKPAVSVETGREASSASDAKSEKNATAETMDGHAGAPSSAEASELGDLKAIVSTSTADAQARSDASSDTKASAEKNKEEASTEEQQHSAGVFHWDLSKKYYKDGDLDMAQTELDLAVLNWPDMKVAHRDLCLLSALRFNFLRSLAEFMMTVGLGEAIPMNEDEAKKLMEDAMLKHYKKGMAYARQRDWKKTANELELASRLAPDDFAVQRALAYAYANLGQWSRAEEHYKTTFELSPHDGSSRADLAYFLASNGKVSEAQKEMEEAVKSQPKAAAYHVDLSYMAESRGDLDTASKELKEAVNLSPKHADLWAHLGRILERKGEKPEAMEAYSKAIAIDPGLSAAKDALNKLEQSGGAPEDTVAPGAQSLTRSRT